MQDTRGHFRLIRLPIPALCAAFIAIPALLNPVAADNSQAAGSAKPRAAVFPLAGDMSEDAREKCGFALRKKLDRDGAYEPVAGPDMKDLVADVDPPVGYDTPVETVRKLGAGVDAAVLVWGELKSSSQSHGSFHGALRLKVLDLRDKDPRPRELAESIDEPTDLRFAIEKVLETLPGVAKFEHPNEEPVHEDEISKSLWARNPNLVANGDFSDSGAWVAIYQSEKYSVKISDTLPDVDKVNIYRMPPEKPGQKANTVLAMRLSKNCAENNGMACLSDPIKVTPRTRYRISFRYRSDGPSTHVFVKGYTSGKNVAGEKADREVFRAQVSPTGATNGKWETVVCDVNPDNPNFAVENLRIDLYAYLTPGVILWDDVVVKEIGPLQTRAFDKADGALNHPATKPKN
jgi:hypothetical protein